MANAEAEIADAMEEQIETERQPTESFSKSTLQFDSVEADTNKPMIDRGRPGSVIGRQSVRSTTSRTSMRPNVTQTEQMSQRFYSYRSGVLDDCLKACQDFQKPSLDGNLKGAWLLTLIDHWDLNHERVILLTDSSLFIVKYDFVCMKLLDYQRVLLHTLTRISVGDLKYPEKSFMYDRLHGAVRVQWEGETPSFGQLWNPFCATIPWIVLAHHPVLYDPKETETVTYNVDDFYETLVSQVPKACQNHGSDARPPMVDDDIVIDGCHSHTNANIANPQVPKACQNHGSDSSPPMVEEDIVIDSNLSITSPIFNQSSLGFFKHRGDFKF